MKLELKHLAPYLPYGLKINLNRNKGMYMASNIDLLKTDISFNSGVSEAYVMYDQVSYGMHDIKPILRPLSDLDVRKIDIPDSYLIEKNFDGNIILQRGNVWSCDWRIVDQYLFENHYDVFELIPAGLAIDINTLNK